MCEKSEVELGDLNQIRHFSKKDIQEIVLDHIFSPGRFSIKVILSALETYRGSLPSSLNYKRLKNIVIETVLHDLQDSSITEISSTQFQV